MTESRAELVVDRLWDLYSDSYSPFPTENIGVDPNQDTSINPKESRKDYWRKTYGGQDAFECLVRTILSQNTSDAASQPAHDALLERYGTSERSDGERSDAEPSDAERSDALRSDVPRSDGERSGAEPAGVDLARALADASEDELAETIAPAGLHNQKSATLIHLAERVVEEYGGAEGFDAFVAESEPSEVRSALLEMKGVGPKTADCVLLFAGGRGGVFPVDTHVHRIARRMGLAPADADHETVREHLERDVPDEKCGFGPQTIAKRYNDDKEAEENEFHNGGTYVVDGEEITFVHGGVPPEKCGFGHTAMIQFGREFCTARKPACLDGPESCPLFDLCDRVGVDLESGEVVDPSEAVSGR